MSSFKPGFARRLGALVLTIAATTTAAAGDDWLRREMAKTDGDPMGDHGVLPLRAPEHAPASARAFRANGAGNGAVTVPARAARMDIMREMARADGDSHGADARFETGTAKATSLACASSSES